ncbi:MAG: S-adenosylmethionine synthetase, partial [Corynebacterium flavescens]|nr:S-adenosylmethionine synthetase [Corynebacterium flavescens]
AGDLGAASESSESRTDLAGQLGALVSELEEDFPGEVGIAVSGASQTSSAGVAGEGPAWSTIKVPIAIAALRDGASPELVNLAIEQSDNDAAYALWSQVKWSEDNATAAIDEVLAGGGFARPVAIARRLWGRLLWLCHVAAAGTSSFCRAPALHRRFP